MSSTIKQSVTFLMLACLVTGLIAMAWPRLLASLQFLPVQQVQPRLFSSNATAEVDLAALIARSQLAIRYHDAFTYHSALSLLHYLQGIDTRSSLYARRQSLEESIDEARIALAGAPLQPDLWLLMLQSGVQLFMPADELVADFRMAIWAGRVEPTHVMTRLQMGFLLLPQLDEEGLSLLRDQVLLAWNSKRHELLSALRKGQLNRSKINQLMAATHPDVVQEMEETLGPVTL